MKGRTPPPPIGAKRGQVEVTSGYGMNTRVPFIEITMPERPPLQLEIDEARIVGQMIIEACEAAEQDGFLVEWSMENIAHGDSEDEKIRIAASLLHEYRQWREQRRDRKRTRSA